MIEEANLYAGMKEDGVDMRWGRSTGGSAVGEHTPDGAKCKIDACAYQIKPNFARKK